MAGVVSRIGGARRGPAVRKSLEAAVRSSVRAAGWLGTADEAVVALAVAYAKQLDDALAGETPDAGVLWRVGSRLEAVMRDLGGTPGARAGLNLEEAARGKLAELRAGRVRDAKVVDASAS